MKIYSSERKTFCFSRRSVVVFLSLGCLASLLVFLVQPFFTGKDIEPAKHVSLSVQPQSDASLKRSFSSEIDTRRTSRLSFEVSGMVKSIYVDVGDPIGAGQILAKLDTKRFEAAKKEAEALLAETKVAMTQAQDSLNRIRKAYSLKKASSEQVEEAQNFVDSQWARTVRVEAQIERIDLDLNKSVLYAPFNGKLAERLIDIGTVVSPGQPILEIIETSPSQVRIGSVRKETAGPRPGAALLGKISGQNSKLRG